MKLCQTSKKWLRQMLQNQEDLSLKPTAWKKPSKMPTSFIQRAGLPLLQWKNGLNYMVKAIRKESRPLKRNYWHRMQSIKTVSYTHLRAHETRHDLVCRLLLEKKKT